MFSVLKWPFPRVLKQSLTTLQVSRAPQVESVATLIASLTLQIMQFVIGGSMAASYFFLSLPALDAPGMKREAGKCLYVIIASKKEDGADLSRCRTSEGATFAVWLNIIYLVRACSISLKVRWADLSPAAAPFDRTFHLLLRERLAPTRSIHNLC